MFAEVENLDDALSKVTDYWSPRIVGQVNDQYVKVAKLKGTFTWHKHDDEDELFFILKGRLRMEYEDHVVDLEKGDVHIVPRNTMHNPIAEEECWVMLVETVTTKHTGDVETGQTKSIDEQLSQT